MATSAPIATSPPVRETPWRIGLVNAARETSNYHDPATGDTALARRVSVAYDTEYPGGANGAASWNPCTDNGPNVTVPTYDDDGAAQIYYPWGIARYVDCPGIGADLQDHMRRARALLADQTSHDIEEVLWSGALDVGTDLETMAAAETPAGSNRRLASSSATLIDGSAAHDLTVALGLINEWAAAQVGGYRVWIHAEARVSPFLSFYGQGTRTTARSAEQMLGDHRFVLGTGYSGALQGDSLGANETWLIVTNPVRVIAGPISPDETENPATYYDRSLNRVRAFARRLVVADWDQSLHGAIKVCLPAPGPACS